MTSTLAPQPSGTPTAAPRPVVVPERPALEGLEAKWGAIWDERGTYRFDRSKNRDEVYAIDTPPPTVSGTLHFGSVCSYTQTDLVARYQRMRGREVFYPIGWDDNGLPTERRVQNHYGVRCDPRLPYDPAFSPPGEAGRQAAGAGLAGQLHRAVPGAHGERRGGLRGALPDGRPVRRLVLPLHDDRRRQPGRLAAGLPAQPQSAGGVPGARADALGRDLPDGGGAGRARGARVPGPLLPDRLPRARPGPCTSRPPGRSCWPPAWRSSPIPTTSATSRCSGRLCAHRSSTSRSRYCRIRPPSRTRGRASPCAARSVTSPTSSGGASSSCRSGRSSAVTAGSSPSRPSGSRPSRPARRTSSSRARPRSAPASRWRSWCNRPAISTASPSPPSGWRTSTRRVTSRSRSSRPASGTSATAVAIPVSERN